MLHYQVVLPLLASYLSIARAAAVERDPNLPSQCTAQAGLTTPPPAIHGAELRKRQDSELYYCGQSGTDIWACVTRSHVCAATILPNGQLRQFCSNTDYGSDNQVVFTTVLGYQSDHCEAPIGCWYICSVLISANENVNRMQLRCYRSGSNELLRCR